MNKFKDSSDVVVGPELYIDTKHTCRVIGYNEKPTKRVKVTIYNRAYTSPIFTITTSKEFIEKIHDLFCSTLHSFPGMNVEENEVKFSVRKGICKMVAPICPGTKIVTRFPVDDEVSFGKIKLSIKSLERIENMLDDKFPE